MLLNIIDHTKLLLWANRGFLYPFCYHYLWQSYSHIILAIKLDMVFSHSIFSFVHHFVQKWDLLGNKLQTHCFVIWIDISFPLFCQYLWDVMSIWHKITVNDVSLILTWQPERKKEKATNKQISLKFLQHESPWIEQGHGATFRL